MLLADVKYDCIGPLPVVGVCSLPPVWLDIA